MTAFTYFITSFVGTTFAHTFSRGIKLPIFISSALSILSHDIAYIAGYTVVRCKAIALTAYLMAGIADSLLVTGNISWAVTGQANTLFS